MVSEIKVPIDHKKVTEEAETKSTIQEERFYNGKLLRHELLHHARGVEARR